MSLILLVEDLAEERQRAIAALRAKGFKPAVATTLEDAFRLMKKLQREIVGVVTDIHFPEDDWNLQDTPASGLAVVAKAVEAGLPVVVCSDVNHHRVRFLEAVIKVLASHQNFAHIASIPFVMDSKDWDQASRQLAEVLERIRA
jgi:CheY-like chemotaxis protein